MICEGLEESIGLKLDRVKNQANNISIHSEESKIKLFVVTTNEELEIARQTQKILTGVL
jgi:acetate kinase